MPLNEVQVDHVNGVVRPFLERLILALDTIDTFVAEYDALQGGANALPTDGTVLDDGAGGTAPRTDAPQLTGAQVALLRDRAASMSAVLSASEKRTLIDKMVRDLATIRGQ